MENIVGGIPALAEDFKYHVGIIGKHNNSNARYLACSGGIISDLFILTSAECLLDAKHELMKLRFYVILGSINLKHNYTAEQEVIFIYTLTHTPLSNRHYLAILQLEDRLFLHVNFDLQRLFLPREKLTFTQQMRIAGYGFKTYEEKKKSAKKSRPTLTTRIDYILTYAYIEISDDQECKNSNPFMHSERQVCGKIESQPELDRRGLCSNDLGGPLVMGEYVVAVANKNRQDCDNTKIGNLYTKVFNYLDFITSVTHANLTKDIVVHRNRIHIMNQEE